MADTTDVPGPTESPSSQSHSASRALAWYMVGWALHRGMLRAGIRQCKAAARVKVSKEAIALAPLLHRCVQPANQPLDVSQEPGAAYVLARQEYGNLVVATPHMADACALAQARLMALLTPVHLERHRGQAFNRAVKSVLQDEQVLNTFADAMRAPLRAAVPTFATEGRKRQVVEVPPPQPQVGEPLAPQAADSSSDSSDLFDSDTEPALSERGDDPMVGGGL